MKRNVPFLSILALLWCEGASAQKTPVAAVPQLGKSPVKAVIKAMTLAEKAKLVTGMGFKMPGATPAPKKKDAVAAPVPAATQPAYTLPPIDPSDDIPEKVPGAAGRTHAIKRLGIPSITVSDGPAGIRIATIRNGDSSKTYYATAFPVGTLLASTWDVDLVHIVGVAFGNEIHEYGADVILGPGANIHRNPLGGRNFEYYSEDPLVSGSMASAIINGIQSQGVGATIKH